MTSALSVLLLALPVPSPAQDAELAVALEALVDLETPAARRKAAASLAKKHPLEDLLAAARDFGRFEPLAAGTSVETVPLRVAKKTEETELHLYVPAAYDPAQPAPLLLAFHGTGGNGRGMLSHWRTVADATGMVVLAPTEAGENEGYRFEERERLSALAALRWVRRRANVDENRVFATGISRGGHLAWDLALRFPDRFAGIAPMIGGPRLQTQRAQNNLRYVENVAHLAIRDLQGAQDDPGLVFNVQLAFERLSALIAKDAELFLHPELGHWFDMNAVDWEEFFTTKRRDPRPGRVVRAAAREDEGRAFWVEVTRYGPNVKEEFTLKVTQSKWNRLDDEGRRRFLATEADARTARLEVRRAGANEFEARGEGVKEFRLLFTEDDFERNQDVVVHFNGGKKKKRLRPSAHVLLAEFCERFDRTFLPVAELEVR
jgi:dienelactone hydrolase